MKNRQTMISRDGACISLWQDDIADYKTRNRTEAGTKYDVIVVGGGISGVSAALLLQKSGLKTALFESHTLCFGTTGGTTAHLNTIMDTPYPDLIRNFGHANAGLVAEAAREAIDRIKANVEEYAIDCYFEEACAYLFSQTEDQSKELGEIGRACLELGLNIDYADKIPIPMECKKSLVVRSQAKFHPVRYVYALAEAFEELGGVIVQHCRVKQAENENQLVIDTDLGKFGTGYLVYATHIPPGLSLLNARCAPYRTYAMAVILNNGAYPEHLIYDMYDPYHYYRTQAINGKKYLIAGGEDHKTGHEENTELPFRRLEAHLREHFDIKEISYRWSSQYFEPADGLPYIGHMPGQPGNILAATGFGGNGMIYSTVAAQLIHDLILGKESRYGKLFDPNRIKPVAGFSNFVRENTDVLKQFIEQLAPRQKIEEWAGIARGESKIGKLDGHLMAVYKDENNNLHAVSPVCTHMKCHVSWNSAEKSWDCPCHGARYDIDGEVLTGPADMDLARVKLMDGETVAG